MKGTFFSKPLEWSIETQGESWPQGGQIKGLLKVKNHGTETVTLEKSGVALAYAEIKKVHAKTDGTFKPEVEKTIEASEIGPGQTLELAFDLTLPENCPVSDKRSSYYLTYGKNLIENHLMLKIEPKALYGKVIGLLDTFQRFKLKEYKGTKAGIEYKLLPPTSRDYANVESLSLGLAMKAEVLLLTFEFQVKKLDTASVTTKINKETMKIKRELTPKEYSLGRDMINQDQLLKMLDGVLTEVRMNNVY